MMSYLHCQQEGASPLLSPLYYTSISTSVILTANNLTFLIFLSSPTFTAFTICGIAFHLSRIAFQLWSQVVPFGVYSLFGGAKAFTSLLLFAVLRFPLFMLSNLITQVVNTQVSLKRLEELFLAEKRILVPNPPLDPALPSISIKDGYFSWDSKLQECTGWAMGCDYTPFM